MQKLVHKNEVSKHEENVSTTEEVARCSKKDFLLKMKTFQLPVKEEPFDIDDDCAEVSEEEFRPVPTKTKCAEENYEKTTTSPKLQQRKIVASYMPGDKQEMSSKLLHGIYKEVCAVMSDNPEECVLQKGDHHEYIECFNGAAYIDTIVKLRFAENREQGN